MIGEADPPGSSDPADRILALEELRDLGLLDGDEFAEAAAASLAEQPEPASAEHHSVGGTASKGD